MKTFAAVTTMLASPAAWAVRIDVGTNGQCTVTEAVTTAMNPNQNPQPGCTRTQDGQTRVLVKIAAGQFSLPATVNVPSSVTIEGAGTTLTTINSTGRAFTIPGSAANPQVQLRNLTLKGTGVGDGMFVNGAPAAAILDTARITTFNIGLRIESPQNLVNGRSTGTVFNSAINDSRAGGISLVNSDIGVASSTIAGNQGAGLRARQFSTNARIEISGNSRIESNSNGSAGGGIRVTCEQAGASDATLSLSDSVVQSNSSSGDGGGVFTTCDTNLFRTKLLNNTSTAGGGGLTMAIPNSGTSIQLSAIQASFENNTADRGGGVMLDGAGTAEVLGIFQQSLIANNRSAHDGGGLLSTAQEEITNCTITSNVAGNPGQTARGGGIFHDGGELHIVHNTISNNTANTAGGGVATAPNNFIVFANIVADNTAPSSATQSPDWVFVGQKPGIAIGGRNFIPNRNGIATEFPVTGAGFNFGGVPPNVGPPPMLGSLQSLGGSTRVRPLLANSPAMDRIPVNEDAVTVDQRGTTRPQNGPDGAGRGNLIDIGAFEATP